MRKRGFCLWFAVLSAVVCLTACGGKSDVSGYSLSVSEQKEAVRQKEETKDTGITETGQKEEHKSIGITNDGQKAPDWSSFTADGVDEERFLDQMDPEMLETVAGELQTLCEEEYEAEKADPEIVLTEGWTRVFQSKRYKKVVAMREDAMMPLYWIIYKSPNDGMYEYICAAALDELSGYDFENGDGTRQWTTAKEFMTLFHDRILSEKSDGDDERR